MAGSNTAVESRYLKYNKAEVERILGSVEHVDDTPTEESDNPVKSGGVNAALVGKLDSVTQEQFMEIFR